MDSNAIEQERGITIMSKVTSIKYGHNSGTKYHINIVDTPGHADFGGEVERIMSMVDGVALIVDASEGVMTQTKFVLGKALARGFTPIVFVNKVDRPSARIDEVPSEIFDLFAELGANDEQLDFPILYGSGKDRWASSDGQTGKDLTPLYELITEHVPAPTTALDAPFSMLVTQISSDQFMGKLLLGRIETGTVKVGDTIKTIDPEGKVLEEIRITNLLSTVGLEKVKVDSASGGEIITIAGCKVGTVNCTLADGAITEPIKHIPIDPPTVAMTFLPNDSPFVGAEGNGATAAMIRDWLHKEAETNVSITIKDDDDDEGSQAACKVFGRGELQLGILIENMRREGFELAVSAPSVVMKKGEDGEILEPIEEVVIECDAQYQGCVIDKLSERKADMVDLVNLGGKVKLVFHVCTRGLIGYRTEFLNDTSGTGVINNLFHSYVPHRGEIQRSIDKKGAIVASQMGTTTTYGIEGLQARGSFFIGAGQKCYPGMVVGEASKVTDVDCNPCKLKQLTNIRAAGKDEKAVLIAPIVKSLEQYISDVRDDEMIEVTTKSIRLRKKIMDQSERLRAKKKKKKLAFSFV